MPQSPTLPAPPWRIAVDVGGTFTDMVLVDAGGRFHVFKTPSVPADPSRGVLDVLEHAARAFGADVERLLSACTLFLHGSTVATNTVLEGSGARVGMLVTRGFRDFLEARRGFRADPFDHRPPYPPVLVPRYLRLPVGGRMDARGAEVEPLDETDLDAAIETFRAEEVESIAVCLLHSFENGAHERRCAEVLRERGGFDWVSLSHAVVPVIGEYERGSTTVVNAYIGPKVVRYLQALDERLRALGLGPDLLVLQSNGRAISTRQVAHCPVNLVLSGPAGGVGALDYFAAATGFDDLITMEIGGTSCDVMLRAGGRVAVTDRLEVGGYDLVSASVDIHTVGAGGGTIAGADAAGLLYAGPRGAGAVPGTGRLRTWWRGADGDRCTARARTPRSGTLCGRRGLARPRSGRDRVAHPSRRAARNRHERGGDRGDPSRRAEPASGGGAHQHRTRTGPGAVRARGLRRRGADARSRGRPAARRAGGIGAEARGGVLRARDAQRGRGSGLRPGVHCTARRGRC